MSTLLALLALIFFVIQVAMVITFFRMAKDVALLRKKVVGPTPEEQQILDGIARARESTERRQLAATQLKAREQAEADAAAQARREEVRRRSIELNGPPVK